MTYEPMTSFASTKKVLKTTKSGEYVTSPEMVEVGLIQFNFVDNQN